MHPHSVYLAPVKAAYSSPANTAFPELSQLARKTAALQGVQELLTLANLDAPHKGSTNWNPFRELVPPGGKIAIKPNWVSHNNGSGQGLECLVTDTSVIEAVIEYASLVEGSTIIIGDAPVQGCNFELLMQQTGIYGMVERFAGRGIPIQIKDFRLTQKSPQGWQVGARTNRKEDEYVLFNLGRESFLNPVSEFNPQFRVTMYNPDALSETHSLNNHQYLIARELLDADLVVNLPKLKTHKKAGITGALKNMVGANGHKSFLPHHRKGSFDQGGDCYSKKNFWRGWIEEALDRANGAEASLIRSLTGHMAGAMLRVGKAMDPSMDVEGSWAGNDTVWRMVLDLQRLLNCGTVSGTLQRQPQRRIMNLTDAIVIGQGEGPLAPEPLELGLMTMGLDAGTCDRVHAALMGLDENLIPLTRQAHHVHSPSKKQALRIESRHGQLALDEVVRQFGTKVRMPSGWQSHCELEFDKELAAC